ncbi:hypothetical protein DB34_07630 [Acetobacter pasteurianus]|nr:hypothetical protein DB34_07630 [Acetobacter pasteurianus]
MSYSNGGRYKAVLSNLLVYIYNLMKSLSERIFGLQDPFETQVTGQWRRTNWLPFIALYRLSLKQLKALI